MYYVYNRKTHQCCWSQQGLPEAESSASYPWCSTICCPPTDMTSDQNSSASGQHPHRGSPSLSGWSKYLVQPDFNVGSNWPWTEVVFDRRQTRLQGQRGGDRGRQEVSEGLPRVSLKGDESRKVGRRSLPASQANSPFFKHSCCWQRAPQAPVGPAVTSGNNGAGESLSRHANRLTPTSA